MPSGGKRGGTRERVLEGRHVIGLFMLILLFSGVFFTLGYVMGRNQYDGQVRAATNPRGSSEAAISPRNDVAQKHSNKSSSAEKTPDTAPPSSSDWEFYHAGDSSKTEDHLKPAAATAATKTAPAIGKGGAAKTSNELPRTNLNTRPIPGGSYILQVAASRKESEAMALAANLQKRKFPAFVLSPQGDKYYRVQVGPYTEQKAAENARKGLLTAGFKAIVKH